MVSMANKRRDRDVMKLMATGYNVVLPDENKMNEIIVDFPGPDESPYVGVSFIDSTAILKLTRFCIFLFV